MMMSTARRRRAKSLGVICLILASLTCSPPTAAVIRPAEAEGADDESDENDVVAVGVGSLSPPEHEFEAEAFVHQRHTDSVRRQPQLGGSNNSILSKIESFFYWRGILGTYREDEDSIIDGQPQQRPEDYGLSPSSSASLRLETNRHGSTTATTRHLRSTTRPADMDQARQRRGSSRSRQASWCEFANFVWTAITTHSFHTHTSLSPTRSLSILIYVLSLINSRGLVHQSVCPILRSQHLQQSQLCWIGTLG
jgi:hypothetical protein